jgi:polyisoprenoid-binding protein YceI
VVALFALALACGATAAAEFTIDPVHSTVIFKVNHLGAANVYGRFDDISGGFTFDPAAPTSATFDVAIKAESVDTNAEKRDQHISGPDFLDSKQFPLIKLKSKSVKKTGEKTFQIAADLELRGVTKPITLEVEHTGTATDPRGTTRAGFEAKFTINRMDYGVSFMPDGLGKDVALIVSIEGVQKSAEAGQK